ncbi:DegT/DnrJ/EryC1/StrS aminotransferase family protein [Geobacter sp. SVR]|uniref:DegT/DnrJ/EryC1/StrS family aminotransferase n=1 Tax=Geobacter sp. SVR TaxID=2495594 RepID=UPI00143EF9BE|nr:DegT/DnrJ/EryC1/StrS family aminotransferase [Geobacter sp. SVR]BCS52430.1 UDP-2-acetamido-2-deoxy-alpha-D-ribo-hexopyranos- 3-ulose 3-aminotransferase [Geobacter sp. SVR]GCF87339.1 UDP-2-acetamido-2-deoxy-alpha-D-ribo-hexopyranos-3-ulose 3-aminotransferase [Geobacter sp. SVR]
MIPMVDLKTQYHDLKQEIDRAVLDAIESSQFILGPNVTAFEQESAAYLGAAHAVSCASGTDALHLAILAAGIGPGDEVITSPFTFIATAEAICYAGATPVFVDIDPQTFNIDPTLIEAAITPRTRAVIPVHLFGQPAELSEIKAICEAHKLQLIEDCAQSFGAATGGSMTGTHGSLGCFSFFPSKNLGCYGDGGLVTCATPELAEQLKVLRNHGSRVRYHHSVIGFNSRLDDIQAAILRVKLKRIDQFNNGRRRVAHLYSELLRDVATVPYEDGKGVHVYHQYTLLTDRRDAVMAHLSERKIACAVYYPIPLHRQDVFAAACAGISLPIAENVASRCMSLPIYPEMPEESVRVVAEAVRESLLG